MATFKVLYFASAAQYTGKDEEEFAAGMTLHELRAEWEKRYPGFEEKVLKRSMVTVELEYVGIEEEGSKVLSEGVEVGVLPPVSAG